MRVAMLGTRGVPAQYGGFETAIEEVGWRLVDRGHHVTIYCRNQGQTRTEYRGMRLVNLPAVRRRSMETLTHTGLSVGHTARDRPDAAVLFNSGNAPYLTLLDAARVPTAVHMDGLEWKRAKWQGIAGRYYKWAEARAARSGTALIADAQGIADYLKTTYGRESHLIAYGAPILAPGAERLHEAGVEMGEYHLVVARLEPENHVHLIIKGYLMAASQRPLVVVGGAPYGDQYIRELRTMADDSVRFVGPMWDQELLDQLYANARSYLHGHSVGGTNPSLLRALGAAAPTSAYDVNFNREVTGGHARFFASADDVADAIRADDADFASALARGAAGQKHASVVYRWDDVADGYEALLMDLANGLGRRA